MGRKALGRVRHTLTLDKRVSQALARQAKKQRRSIGVIIDECFNEYEKKNERSSPSSPCM